MEKPTLHSRVDPTRLPEVLWSEDVAAVLGVRPAQARRMMRTGKIPAKRVGRRWFALREHLLRALAP